MLFGLLASIFLVGVMIFLSLYWSGGFVSGFVYWLGVWGILGYTMVTDNMMGFAYLLGWTVLGVVAVIIEGVMNAPQ